MRMIKRLFRLFFLVVIITAAIIIASGYGKYKQAISLLPIEDAAQKIKSAESFTPIEEISDTFVKAMVAVEDKRFYKHKGIDVIGIGRALKNNFQKRSLIEGGSCITQQLAKNIYFMQDNSLSRKVAEVMVAVNLEKKYSKDEILELYFNVIYYGSGCYNVREASLSYFGKLPSKLSDYEATILAGIPNAPSVYSLNNNPDLAKKRQKKVLDAMVEMKYINEEQASQILSEQ